MSHRLTIRPRDYEIQVNTDETVLASALRHGLTFPHRCRNAICGSCKGKVLSGEIDYRDKPTPALSDGEREEGLALFCSAYLCSDLDIEMEGVLAPYEIPMQSCQAKQLAISSLNERVLLVQLEVDKAFHYLAGQYVELSLQGSEAIPLSIANMPESDNRLLSFHLKEHEGNPQPSELLALLKEGKHVNLKGPFGRCVMQSQKTNPILFVAGGTGFAPHKALIEAALAESNQRNMTLYWGVRTEDDFYDMQLIQRWAKYRPNFHFIPVVSEPEKSPGWSGRAGLIHQAVLEDIQDFSDYQVYASGPYEMVQEVYKGFTARGLAPQNLFSDMLALDEKTGK